MSAKEMFEKLGYKQDIHFSCIEYDYNDEDDIKCIYFWCSNMTIEANFAFDIKVLQAINKQVEELGWLNVYNDMCEYDNDKPISNDEY